MNDRFQIHALDEREFASFFQMSEKELEQYGISKVIVDEKPGYPCRVSLQDADVGEEVILLSYTHHNVSSPYRSAGPIYVRRSAVKATFAPGEIPAMLNRRLLSVRGYDKNATLMDALVVEGRALRETINRMFDTPSMEYLHIHNAKPGCFNCAVTRIS